MARTNRAEAQPSISLRLPTATITYLDAVAEQRTLKTGITTRRADVLQWLLSRVPPPTAPTSPLERRLSEAHKAAFGDDT